MDEIFSSLAHEERRRLLVALLDKNPQSVEVHRLIPTVQGDAQADRRVHARMVHTHLPKLADAGVITWDRETDAITSGPNFDAVRPILELLSADAEGLTVEWV